MSTATRKSKITGLVLAGGQGSRLGGRDKGLTQVAGKPLIAHVLNRLKPQVNSIIISANRNIEQYGQWQCPVVVDTLRDFQGPLAGIAAALPEIKTDYLLVVPCDLPLLPLDLVDRLWVAMDDEEADMAIAHDGEQLQHLCALIRRSAAASVYEFLDEGERAVKEWANRMFPAVAWFADQAQAFRNINSEDDLRDVEAALRASKSKS
jgi:molybdenum cofactor guanylyltransferase